MSEMNFLPYTLLAGAAFGCALLWVLVQWLRADEISDSVEREVQVNMKNLAAKQASAPSATGLDSPQIAASELEPTAEDLAREAYEAKLASMLWWWGISGTIVGMVAGGAVSSFTGALLGGLVAPVLTTIGVLVALKIKAPVAVKQTAVTPAESKPETSPASSPVAVHHHAR